MALNPHLSDTSANASAVAIGALANSGKLAIYQGTQPANANGAASGSTLLATLTLAASAFGAPVAGVITAAAITSAQAVAGGTAQWFRVFESDGITALFDGSVGLTSGNNINMAATTIVQGAYVSVSALTFTVTE
jgi:hypothetical protein